MADAAGPDGDAVLDALDLLVAAARSNITAWVTLMDRAEVVRAQRKQGIGYTEMTREPGEQSLVNIVAANQERLTAAAAQFRRALAHQLIAEGWSTGDVARAFQVSRQRIAALLKGQEPATAVVYDDGTTPL